MLTTPITSDLLPPEPWMSYEEHDIEFDDDELLDLLDVDVPDVPAELEAELEAGVAA